MESVNPLFVYGHPKTGTTLLKSLLDGTSEVYVYPNEVKFKYYAIHSFASSKELVVHYKTRNKDPLKVPTSQALRGDPASIHNLNALQGSLVGVQDLDEVFDIRHYYTVFDRYLQERLGMVNGAALIYYDLLSAARATQGVDVGRLRYLCFKDVGGDCQKIISAYQREFPQGKLILVVRNPYAQLLSRLKYWDKTGWKPNNALAQILNLQRLDRFYHCVSSQMGRGANVLAVKYEDLVTEPQRVMEGVAHFLGIGFSEQLLTPSVFGRPVVVATATQKTNQIFSASLEKWKTELSPLQKHLVTLFAQNASSHGYQLDYRLPSGLQKLLSSDFLQSLSRVYFRIHRRIIERRNGFA